MRPFAIGILFSAAFLATAACSKSPDSKASDAVNAGGEVTNAGAEEYFTVKADDLTPANANITALQGTFQMVSATAADGIPSTGGGGACLVFRAKDLGFTTMDKQKCSKNSDCTVLPPKTVTNFNDPEFYSYAPDPANPSHREARFGYCDTQNNQCWSKPIALPTGPSAPPPPEPPVCNRPIKMTAGTVNAVPKMPKGPGPGATPVDVSEWVKIGAKARVVACLQKTGAKPGISPDGTGCASNDGPDRIEVWGNEATLHK